MTDRKGLSIQVALMSDLHLFDQSKKNDDVPSWLGLQHVSETTFEFTNKTNPWKSLEDLIETHEIRADILLSPGDITTRGDHCGLKAGWMGLQSLGKKLEAHVVAAATGNHDVRSRPKDTSLDIRSLNDATDLFEDLKTLTPPYPLHVSNVTTQSGHTRRLHYFGADFVIHDEDDRFRLVILNSCGRHTTEAKEYERARIANSTLGWLKEELAADRYKKDKINILLCHHHPIQHEEQDLGSYDFMMMGSVMLDELAKQGYWIVMHGHKHHARIKYSGTCAEPLIIAAASFAATPRNLPARNQNQFYVIDITLPIAGGPPKGTIRAWNWNHHKGWTVSTSMNDGIYTGCGFGVAATVPALAAEIASLKDFPIKWQVALSKIPELQYLTPAEFNALRRETRRKNLIIEDDDGVITQIARAPA